MPNGEGKGGLLCGLILASEPSDDGYRYRCDELEVIVLVKRSAARRMKYRLCCGRRRSDCSDNVGYHVCFHGYLLCRHSMARCLPRVCRAVRLYRAPVSKNIGNGEAGDFYGVSLVAADHSDNPVRDVLMVAERHMTRGRRTPLEDHHTA